MAKWMGRGRPKTARIDGQDKGTPELQKKKRSGMLAEPADICLERGIITVEEHWCAIHFRWLYTLRYGLPSVTAVNPEWQQSGVMRAESGEWEECREAEYQEAADVLKESGAHRDIINFAVMNAPPAFLLPYDERNFRNAENSLEKIKTGLTALCSLWLKGRKEKRSPGLMQAKERREEQPCLHQ